MLNKSLFQLKLIGILLFGLLPLLSPKIVWAVNCAGVPISGNYAVSSSCSFTNTVDGVDSGTGGTNTAVITVNSAITLTILAGQSIAAGSITNNGTITIIDTGQIKPNASIYVTGTDADADGYATNTTQATTGSVRRNTLTSVTLTDCDDTTNTKWQLLAGYADADGDTYGAGSSQQVCSGTSLAAGYVTNASDCYDGNANARPGQTAYYTTNRGDGGFDYDCNGTADIETGVTYHCTACTNGSGYASTQAGPDGWISVTGPDCGSSETWYNITNSTCQDPAVSDCSGAYTTTSRTMACR